MMRSLFSPEMHTSHQIADFVSDPIQHPIGYISVRKPCRESAQAELALSGFNALNGTHREHPLVDFLGTRVIGWLTVRL